MLSFYLDQETFDILKMYLIKDNIKFEQLTYAEDINKVIKEAAALVGRPASDIEDRLLGFLSPEIRYLEFNDQLFRALSQDNFDSRKVYKYTGIDLHRLVEPIKYKWISIIVVANLAIMLFLFTILTSDILLMAILILIAIRALTKAPVIFPYLLLIRWLIDKMKEEMRCYRI